jgi:hypothetical protein
LTYIYFFEDPGCPLWYKELNNVLKEHIDHIIGDSKHRHEGLEKKLIFATSLGSQEIRDLLVWKFGVPILVNFIKPFL